jgi:LuxR family quorum sensing-dependent transcriptional regulator
MGDSSSEFVRDALEIMDQLESLRDPAPMIDRVAGWLAQFGYDSFLITGMPAPHRERLEPYILLNHWPMEWYDRYTSANHYRADPVARHCFATIQPFAWSELPPSSLTSAAALRVMSEASDCGLREGLCIPLHDVHGFQAAVTMAATAQSCRPRRAGWSICLRCTPTPPPSGSGEATTAAPRSMRSSRVESGRS